MQAITDSILHEDWPKIEKIAPEIADHRQPPLFEKIRILSYVGSDVTTYKGYDGETHDAAMALGEAAAASDGVAVIAAFARLQTSCLDCHYDFRRDFVKHFYEEN